MTTDQISARRIEILGSPRQWAALPVGDPRRLDSRYRGLATVAVVNLPRRLAIGERFRASLKARDALIARTVFGAVGS